MRFIYLLAVVCAAVTESSAQPLVWEHVGDRPIGANSPSLAHDGTLWSVESSGRLYRLAAPYGPEQTWQLVNGGVFSDYVLALGQDTLLAQTDISTGRSTNGGSTFVSVPSTTPRINAPAQIPQGVPLAGSIVASAGNTAAFGAYSRDRGASWHSASIAVPQGERGIMDEFTVVRRGPRAGRIIAAGSGWGLATSDDGGVTYRPVPGFWQYFRYTCLAVAVIEGVVPGGGDRILALMNYPGHVPDIEVLVAASDDGGDTWYELSELTGDPNYAAAAMADFGSGRVAAVMNGGHVWQSGNGGASWLRTGSVPGAIASPDATGLNGRVFWALKGPDERLYVGGSRLGNSNPGWTFRTADPLSFAVAGEEAPAETPRLGVSVRPNPAAGRVKVVLTLAEASSVRAVAVDALGREVAVVLDGAVSSGERVVDVDVVSWPAGVYVVRVVAGAQKATAQLVVSR